jgi:hypothetical protein
MGQNRRPHIRGDTPPCNAASLSSAIPLPPRLLARPLRLPVHQPSDLPVLRSPISADDWVDVRAGLAALAGVWSRYEAWARDALGAVHRTQVLALVPRHKRRRFSRATDLAQQWNAHAPHSTMAMSACH